MQMTDAQQRQLSKVPEVTLVFWTIKILATTLGETAGDAASMSLNLGYLDSTIIFAVVFLAAVVVQIASEKFHPVIYWITIVATTTVGTTLADFADRSVGIGYAGGSTLLLSLLIASLLVWRRCTGSVSVNSVYSSKSEVFYWVTIMFSQTLGTALGDWMSDSMEVGYIGSVAVFGGTLILVALAHYFTKTPRTILFWAAFILTRPLGAVVGDFLDKPVDHGGLDLSRFTASGILMALIGLVIFVFPQRPAQRSH